MNVIRSKLTRYCCSTKIYVDAKMRKMEQSLKKNDRASQQMHYSMLIKIRWSQKHRITSVRIDFVGKSFTQLSAT